MDAFAGEDERVELMIARDECPGCSRPARECRGTCTLPTSECKHEHVAPVCVRCGEAMPAPHPGYVYGVGWDNQDWDGWIA